MQKLDSARKREQAIIIVAPADADVRLVRDGDSADVMAFSSSEEFDAWTRTHETIRADVQQALADLGCAVLPASLATVIEALCDCVRVPELSILEKSAPSRRSFYRVWSANVRETPSAFLRRVRTAHARRLLASGMSRKEAALVSGFSSVDQMRRHVGKKSKAR